MKKTIKVIMMLGIISYFIPTSVYAEPAYLECKTTNKDKKVLSFSVKFNEANNKITHTGEYGTFNAEGFFSAKTIGYKIIGDFFAETYLIDRTTLEVTIMYMDPEPPALPVEGLTYKGSCEVVVVKDRKI